MASSEPHSLQVSVPFKHSTASWEPRVQIQTSGNMSHSNCNNREVSSGFPLENEACRPIRKLQWLT